jgi:cysteine-rich repeat protein
MARGSLLGIALLAGCNSLLGIHDPERTDGPVTGTWIDDHVTATGTVPVAVDLASWDIAAYVPDPDQPTGYRAVPALITGPGAFGFADLPASYLVRIQPRSGTVAPEYFQATARTIDLGQEVVGRPDLQPATLAGSLAFDIAGPTPYWSSDYIMLYSLGASTLITDYQSDALIPHKGFRGHLAWSGVNSTYYYGTFVGVLANDDLWAVHMRSDSNGSLPLEAATFSGVTASDGATVSIPGGTFVRGPDPMGVPLVSGGDYRAALGLDRPPGIYDSLSLSIYASPGHGVNPTVEGVFGGWGITVPGPPLVPTVTIPAGSPYAIHVSDPFPASWEPVVIDAYRVGDRGVLAPGTSGYAELMDEVVSIRPLGNTIELGPIVSSPRHLQVDGAAGDHVIAPHPAVVRWDPVAGASSYRLSIQSIEQQSPAPQTLFVPVATLYTTDTSVAVPGDLLLADHRYVFQVSAVVDGAGYADGKLRRSSRPHGEASAHSGIVLVSATCGNGKLDPGEECDAGGPSASCDFDCTAPLCGDGVVNPAAGEACDTLGFDPPCGFDCRGPPVCGNGKPETSEQCDDGNTVDGDGCSHLCQIENLCGNGHVDLGEQCDDGNQDNTDGCRNCQVPRCGDGVLDTGLGEQCDDGNQVSGDGCSASCQTEPPPT